METGCDKTLEVRMTRCLGTVQNDLFFIHPEILYYFF